MCAVILRFDKSQLHNTSRFNYIIVLHLGSADFDHCIIIQCSDNTRISFNWLLRSTFFFFFFFLYRLG